jgi:predicted DCC family thiol-disulfide oxidoreductase YuxK
LKRTGIAPALQIDFKLKTLTILINFTMVHIFMFLSLAKHWSMSHTIIYDGRCNLCVSLVRVLEQLEQGRLFSYVPMQDTDTLAQWQITPQDCEAGMIVLDDDEASQRWQGSAAAEKIAALLPAGAPLIAAYRALPGLKWLGDRTYEQVRDHRYQWFGQYPGLYQSAYPNAQTGSESNQNSDCPSCSIPISE